MQSPSESRIVQTFRRLGGAGPLAIAALLLPMTFTYLLFTQMTHVAHWFRSHGQEGIAWYVLGVTALLGISVLPTNASTVLAGWAFGFGPGFAAAATGFLCGSLIGFAIARRVAGNRVVQVIDEHPKWKLVYDTLVRSGVARATLIVGLLRVAPNFPFAATNVILASTRVPLPAFVGGTVLGMMPRLCVLTYFASHAATLDLRESGDRWMLVGGILLTVCVLGIIGFIAKHGIERVSAGEPPREPPAENV